jgi:hypothetical protein
VNIWRRFADLLPGDPLLIGTVTAAEADGAWAVTLPGGAIIKARGDAALAQTVFVRSGIIEGQAPALSVVEIEV